jgi:hypothetical protein
MITRVPVLTRNRNYTKVEAPDMILSQGEVAVAIRALYDNPALSGPEKDAMVERTWKQRVPL